MGEICNVYGGKNENQRDHLKDLENNIKTDL
jgi:hypothetical protein